jgi:hypothetical protein
VKGTSRNSLLLLGKVVKATEEGGEVGGVKGEGTTESTGLAAVAEVARRLLKMAVM